MWLVDQGGPLWALQLVHVRLNFIQVYIIVIWLSNYLWSMDTLIIVTPPAQYISSSIIFLALFSCHIVLSITFIIFLSFWIYTPIGCRSNIFLHGFVFWLTEYCLGCSFARVLAPFFRKSNKNYSWTLLFWIIPKRWELLQQERASKYSCGRVAGDFVETKQGMILCNKCWQYNFYDIQIYFLKAEWGHIYSLDDHYMFFKTNCFALWPPWIWDETACKYIYSKPLYIYNICARMVINISLVGPG